MSLQNQAVSTAAWNDESHVIENREQYRQKYLRICPLLDDHFEYIMPDAGFYLWLNTEVDDLRFAETLYRDQSLAVLPGSLLGRDTQYGNPGAGYIRLALVASIDECEQAIERLITHSQTFQG